MRDCVCHLAIPVRRQDIVWFLETAGYSASEVRCLPDRWVDAASRALWGWQRRERCRCVACEVGPGRFRRSKAGDVERMRCYGPLFEAKMSVAVLARRYTKRVW